MNFKRLHFILAREFKMTFLSFGSRVLRCIKDTNSGWKLVLIVFGVSESTVSFLFLHLEKHGT